MSETSTSAMAGDDELPDARLFWKWAGQASRPIVGWVLMALGAVFIVAGYVGVSGEALVAKQLPYIVSGGVAGLGLVAVGAFILGTEDLRGRLDRLEEMEAKIDELHGVLLVAVDEVADTQPASATVGDGARRARSARTRRATADA